MATWSQFYPKIRLEVAECPIPIVKDAVRWAATEFCKKSTTWRVTLDPIDIAADQAAYALTGPDGTVVSEIITAWYDGREILPKTEKQLKTLDDEWRDIEGTPEYYVLLSPRVMTLTPYPADDLTDGLELRVALKPSITATTIDDTIYEDYYETIGAGALGRLLLQQGRPWYNASLATFYREQFEQETNAAKGLVDNSHSPRVARTVRYGGY